MSSWVAVGISNEYRKMHPKEKRLHPVIAISITILIVSQTIYCDSQ